MWLVVGLGNPGSEYSSHRHNIGFMVVDELARKWRASFRSKFGAEVAATTHAILLKPQEYMNLSGRAVAEAIHFYKIEPEQTVVVHDELDHEFTKLRVKVGGGHGGHNGLRSVVETIGADFLRIRCGIGKPANKEQVTFHVLSGFDKEEKKNLPLVIGRAVSAVELVIERGATVAMNQVNTDK